MNNNEAIQRLMILREQVGPLSRMALDKAIDALESQEKPNIDANEPKREWTPTNKELPELEKYVLCQCHAGIVEILRLTEYGWCNEIEGHYMQSFVIAWMPLPEPYKEGTVR